MSYDNVPFEKYKIRDNISDETGSACVAWLSDNLKF